MSPRAHMAGYTLVELLVVLAIIGMLLAAATPMLFTTRPGLQAKAAEFRHKGLQIYSES